MFIYCCLYVLFWFWLFYLLIGWLVKKCGLWFYLWIVNYIGSWWFGDGSKVDGIGVGRLFKLNVGEL